MTFSTLAGIALLAACPLPGTGSDDQPHEFTIPVDRQQLIGVTYATVVRMPLHRTLRAVGLVAATMAKHWDYVARVDGYIHVLNVIAPGDRVRQGEVLMDLYSPDVVATENEYIDLLRMREQALRDKNPAAAEDAERLLAGARARLEQWNISDGEIDAVAKAGKAPEYLALESPFTGEVEDVNVHQGRHVSVGDHLVDLVDLSSVCVYAEFYQDELPLLSRGLAVAISGPSIPNLSIPARIRAIDPNLDEVKRTGKVRIDMDNPDDRLRPGAYVDVALSLDEGEGLAIPVEAVLPTGEKNIVFVDKGEGRLEPRFIAIGGKFGEFYRVTRGLAEGERVVSSANFLVDAESKVQGALKSW
jgi:Cu(I)/Ag(I) efflux system membrane fusion protein